MGWLSPEAAGGVLPRFLIKSTCLGTGHGRHVVTAQFVQSLLLHSTPPGAGGSGQFGSAVAHGATVAR